MNKPITIGLCGVALSLVGCQSATPIDSSEATLVKRILVDHCGSPNEIVKQPDYASKKMDISNATVYAISDQPDGWKSGSVKIMGGNATIYFNPKTKQFFCGKKNWRKFREADKTTDEN
ncbi:MAG: hypothetical protein OQK24_06730 [Magnetovibrio sp.]|nr:hypothetical protein [Magnetovibrio sp.]